MSAREDSLGTVARLITGANVATREALAAGMRTSYDALVTQARRSMSKDPRERLLGRLNLTAIQRGYGPRGRA